MNKVGSIAPTPVKPKTFSRNGPRKPPNLQPDSRTNSLALTCTRHARPVSIASLGGAITAYEAACYMLRPRQDGRFAN